MRRSPWFNARTQPPVNGGDDAVYEHRCFSIRHTEGWRKPMRVNKWLIKIFARHACCYCQWRGLLLEDGDGQ